MFAAPQFSALCLVGSVWMSHAFAGDTNKLSGTDEIPPLNPPMEELPATLWERHGQRIFLGTAGALCAGGLGAALWFNRRREERERDPAEFARAQLHDLEGKPEDGKVLTAASRVVKGYFSAAFGLGGVELTTTEFLAELGAQRGIKEDLKHDAQAFLQECDLRKFSPAPPLAAHPALPRAFDLVKRAEAARIQTDATSQSKPPNAT